LDHSAISLVPAHGWSTLSPSTPTSAASLERCTQNLPRPQQQQRQQSRNLSRQLSLVVEACNDEEGDEEGDEQKEQEDHGRRGGTKRKEEEQEICPRGGALATQAGGSTQAGRDGGESTTIADMPALSIHIKDVTSANAYGRTTPPSASLRPASLPAATATANNAGAAAVTTAAAITAATTALHETASCPAGDEWDQNHQVGNAKGGTMIPPAQKNTPNKPGVRFRGIARAAKILS